MKKIIIFLSFCLTLSLAAFAQDTPKEFNLSDCDVIIKVSNPEAVFDEFAPLLARIDKYAEMVMMGFSGEEPGEISVTEQFKTMVMEYIDEPYVNKEGNFYFISYEGFIDMGYDESSPSIWYLLIPINGKVDDALDKFENYRVFGNYMIVPFDLSYYYYYEDEEEEMAIPAITVDNALSLDKNIVIKMDFDSYATMMESYYGYDDTIMEATEANMQFMVDNLDYMEMALYYDNDTLSMSGFCQPVKGSVFEEFMANAGDGVAEDILKFLPNKDYANVLGAILDMGIYGSETEMANIMKGSSNILIEMLSLGAPMNEDEEDSFSESLNSLIMSLCMSDFAFGYTSPYNDKASNATLIGVMKIDDIKGFKANIDNIMGIVYEEEVYKVEEWYDGDYEEYLAYETTIQELDVTNKFNATASGEYVLYNVTFPSYYGDATVLSMYVGYLKDGYLTVTFGPERFDKALIANMTDTLKNIKAGGANGFTTRADFKNAGQYLLPKSKQIGLLNLSYTMSSVLDIFVEEPMQKVVFGNMLKALPYQTTLSGMRYSTNYANGRNEFIMSAEGNDIEYFVNTLITAISMMYMM